VLGRGPWAMVPPGGGRVLSTFAIGRPSQYVAQLAVPGTPEDAALFPAQPIYELFRWISGQIVQVTNFHRVDTRQVGFSKGDVLFIGSADPFGTNRFHNCQLFRVSPLGARLRQLTNFTENQESMLGCEMGEEAGCGIIPVSQDDSRWHRVVFYSDCDP